jgi:integrase
MKKTIDSNNGVVRFSFKDPIHILEASKKKESLIFLHFSYGRRFKYSTGYKSCFENWDFDKQKIKETKSNIINAREVNEFLSNIENAIKKEYSRLIAENLNITNELLKSFLDDLLNKNNTIETPKILSFFDFANSFLEIKEKEISIITKRSYKQTLEKIKNYSIYSSEKITFNTFDKYFAVNFVSYLEELEYSQNTVSKHFKNLKTFLKEADRKRLITNINFNITDYSVKPEQTTAIYLTDEEIKLMFNMDLSKYKELELARDVFLMGCYSGQRVSDYNGLSKESIKNINGVNYFVIKQKKTKTVVQCPITKEMIEIMNTRYNGNPPHKILEQDLNKNIKQVGQILGFNELVEISITKGGKEKNERLPKYSLIHSHTARRSFCTNMYKRKMSPTDIMHFSGHKTEREFYKYIRIYGEERASHIVGQGFFNV